MEKVWKSRKQLENKDNNMSVCACVRACVRVRVCLCMCAFVHVFVRAPLHVGCWVDAGVCMRICSNAMIIQSTIQ